MQLIDRHALLKNVYDNPPEKARMTYAEWCRKCIYEAPTIEAEPVRHGRWIPNGKRSVFGDLEYICSECSRKITVNWAVKDPSEYNAFCSGCGAHMDASLPEPPEKE